MNIDYERPTLDLTNYINIKDELVLKASEYIKKGTDGYIRITDLSAASSGVTTAVSCTVSSTLIVLTFGETTIASASVGVSTGAGVVVVVVAIVTIEVEAGVRTVTGVVVVVVSAAVVLTALLGEKDAAALAVPEIRYHTEIVIPSRTPAVHSDDYPFRALAGVPMPREMNAVASRNAHGPDISVFLNASSFGSFAFLRAKARLSVPSSRERQRMLPMPESQAAQTPLYISSEFQKPSWIRPFAPYGKKGHRYLFENISFHYFYY